jgi:hypothetical protein
VEKKAPKSDFYALLSHMWYTMCIHFAISMFFMDMVLTIVIQYSRYTIFLVCTPCTQLPFPYPFTQYSHYCKHKSYYSVLHMHDFKSVSVKVLIKRKTSFSQRPANLQVTRLVSTRLHLERSDLKYTVLFFLLSNHTGSILHIT